MMQNNYDQLIDQYKRTNNKPDKLYSVLPTISQLLQSVESPNVVLDLGCGDGFFTKITAINFPNAKVIGIDNSESQLEKAKVNCASYKNIQLVESDIFTDNLPLADIIIAPFVINYLITVPELEAFFKKIKECLTSKGAFIGVIDNPQGFNNKKYGAIKSVNKRKDGEKIKIDLYDEGQDFICTLYSYYFTQEAVHLLLLSQDFKVSWHTPIVSEEGISTLGKEYWNGYSEHCELLYFVAKKT